MVGAETMWISHRVLLVTPMVPTPHDIVCFFLLFHPSVYARQLLIIPIWQPKKLRFIDCVTCL